MDKDAQVVAPVDGESPSQRTIVSRQQYLLGATLLHLVSSWDEWIERRVDRFAFADDERVLDRHQSVDFIVPEMLREQRLNADAPGRAPIAITFARKWRLSRFSLRDEADAAVPLLTRSEATPLAAGMLLALASFVIAGTIVKESVELEAIRQTLIDIAAGESVDALRACMALAGANDEISRRLAADQSFMGLAYELARSFPVIAYLSLDDRRRRLLKLSYSSYVLPARRDWRPVQIRHLARFLRSRRWDLTESAGWEHSNDPPASNRAGPRIALCAEGDYVVDGLRERESESGMACALATLVGPDKRRRTVRLRPNSSIALHGLPLGEYRLTVKGVSGFDIDRAPPSRIEITGDEEVGVWLSARRVDVTRHVTQATPRIAGRAWAGLRFTRGLALNNKPLAIRIRMGQGGSYHCEFSAPEGMHVTRARLISDVPLRRPPISEPEWRGREFDVMLESKPRAELDVERTPIAAGYVYLHLRPRVDTVGRSALISGTIATLVLVFVALTWNSSEGYVPHGPKDSSALVALILGAPSAFAAYFVQGALSRVTTSVLSALRVAALLPSFLALGAGAVMLTGKGQSFAHPLLDGLAIAGAVITLAIAGSAWLAEHPMEQARGNQGPGFKETYSARLGVQRSRADEPPPVASDSSPDEIRRLMLERATGMDQHTRRTLLSQKTWLRRWTYQVSPSLYFGSAEIAPTFRGLSEGDVSRIKMQVSDPAAAK